MVNNLKAAGPIGVVAEMTQENVLYNMVWIWYNDDDV